MKILDIDLDFFISDIAHFIGDGGERLDEGYYKPWKPEYVRRFLEDKCGLSLDKKVKGRMIKNHDEAFYFWKELISTGKLVVPFDVVHVDAHADLGLGDASWAYILSDLLRYPPEERTNPKTTGLEGLGFGNYLAFAIACRWISRLDFVLHPEWDNDLPYSLLKDFDDASGAIQLKLYNRRDIDVDRIRKAVPLSIEPEVPFCLIKDIDFSTKESFDYIVLCQSPGYTPQSPDLLLDVIADYIELI
ncbi:UPF0489 family protein [Paenibacillus sp. Marseille-Q4541]|uniref:UPF0489 family protein n=1 Tax=Paenibacillus sp. Marseille-Q4541 TaxID=2831522 RepID=UPI001BA762D9|nr:UPF0489 family protein [Paenibacillus sp. Marseille-Q4541]